MNTRSAATIAATARALDREWDLFVDWCASWDLGPLPATAEIVEQFLKDLPAAPSTRSQQIRAIRARHEAAGFALALLRTGRPPSALWRQGDSRLDPRQAMAQQPRYRFPVGVRGRRDAFLILLAGELGMTRAQIRTLAPDQVHLDGNRTRVGEKVLGWEEDPRRCPGCVARRWLQVVSVLLAGRDRGATRDLLDIQRASPGEHDCQKPVAPGWEQVNQLVTSVDQWGWVPVDPTLSTRTLTTVMGPLRVRTDMVEDVISTRSDGGQFRDLTNSQLAEKQDEVLDEVEALDLRIQQLLDEAGNVDSILRAHLRPS
ncbi:hypothetical protein AX769_22390 (plasmid) [Frondihabitans sp. PAMC 28766]|uniref:hypothetical protein n=1 Tax=Frondihabitans sp. PAMC 28766 TaxID=1795630 RepID=UPI00078EB9E7|nr:hypothetical protein [Frondihabitans sp. PAMC 28766]AMM22877.1 hypothetical protein AX769_22390 [Frondihabitans sp. PAMC 28766]